MKICGASFVNIPSRHLARIPRVLIVSALVLTVASIMYFGRFTMLRAASSQYHLPLPAVSGPVIPGRTSGGSGDIGSVDDSIGSGDRSPMSPDAVFRRLDTLLTRIDAEVYARCPHPYGAGGRCFHCFGVGRDGNSSKHSTVFTVDGMKPVCLDLLPVGCSVLSFGINHDFSFEEAMEDLGCVVHAFDPTMGVDSYRRSSHMFFNNLGIGSTDTDLGGFPVSSLGSIVRHRPALQTGVIHYMKLDVEMSEWEVLHQQLTSRGDLLRVHQLNVEFHLFQWTPVIAEGEGMKPPSRMKITYEDAVRFIGLIEALQDAGFGLVSGMPNYACQDFEDGCLSFLYDTHWINKNINSSRVA